MSDRPQWQTPAGLVRGWYGDGTARASGIPYATTRRFEPPVPVLDLPSPFEATTPSPVCPQHPVPFLEEVFAYETVDVVYDEDCTKLSVTAPADAAPGDDLPVMVWIHGGSYTSGAGDMPGYDPTLLVTEQRVVVVSVTYRLGMLGYLGGPDARPANLGLLDQLCALQWVARNIAAFGGDPDNVTAFGESAGGDAVAHLMVTDGAAGLFRRAIVQSAPLGLLTGRGPMVEAMLQASATLDASASLEEVLRAEDDVVAAARSHGIAAAMPFGVQYGAAPLPAEDDLEAAWQEAAARVDLLIGHTTREGALYVAELPHVQATAGTPLVGAATAEATVRYLTEIGWARPARRFAHRHREAGGHGYSYVLDWGAPANPLRAAHCSDLPLLFGDPVVWATTPLVAGMDADAIRRDGARLRQLWGQFARTGRLRPGTVEGVVTVRPLP